MDTLVLLIETKVTRLIVRLEMKSNSVFTFSDSAMSEAILSKVSFVHYILLLLYVNADVTTILLFFTKSQKTSVHAWFVNTILVLAPQIQSKFKGVKLQWRVQPDRKIFHKKDKKFNKAC